MRSILLPLFCVLTAVHCGTDTTDPVYPSEAASAPPSETLPTVGITLPFKAHYEARSVGVGPGLGCNARLFLEGEGTGTYLGNFTIKLSFCGRGDGNLDSGTGTFVAANGDMLDIIFHGISDRGFPVLHFTSYVTFTGGTGRFEGATGTATVDGSFDTRTNSGPADWDGMITFSGKGER